MHGSIPACAGEPSPTAYTAPGPRVYPRVCGGTSKPRLPWPRARGLSPRVRGNRLRLPSFWLPYRSIPACAGEPYGDTDVLLHDEVYPRVCGGTICIGGMRTRGDGLSPRVRGNHRRDTGRGLTRRSIPACAGEPSARYRPRTHSEVYPRVCGGTFDMPLCPAFSKGLSPRVRGNPRPWYGLSSLRRSIPACAGEPPRDGIVA